MDVLAFPAGHNDFILNKGSSYLLSFLYDDNTAIGAVMNVNRCCSQTRLLSLYGNKHLILSAAGLTK